MKNITAQYRDLQEGKLSKANFMANVRREFPQWISPINSFNDAVSILKSKRILSEDITSDDDYYDMQDMRHSQLDQIAQDAGSYESAVVELEDYGVSSREAEAIASQHYPEHKGSNMTEDYEDEEALEAKLSWYLNAMAAAEKRGDTKAAEEYDKKARDLDRQLRGPSEKVTEGGESKPYYLVDNSGEVIDSTMATSPEEARQYFEDTYEGIGTSMTVIHTDAPEDIPNQVYEDSKEIEALRAGALREGKILKEAAGKSEGSYKSVTGKKQYEIFQQIDRVNPYEFKRGLDIEMGMQYTPVPNSFTELFNPEALAKATKKVLKNLEKHPAYYTNMISAEYEKKSGLKQNPKEVKTDSAGTAKVKGFNDAKSNTETTLSKKERAKGKPEGVKEMKPTKKSAAGVKTMKSNDKLPKGVQLMKEGFEVGDQVEVKKEYGGGMGTVSDIVGTFVVLDNGQSYHESDLMPVRQEPRPGVNLGGSFDKFKNLREYLKKKVKEDLEEKLAVTVRKDATDQEKATAIDKARKAAKSTDPNEPIDIIEK